MSEQCQPTFEFGAQKHPRQVKDELIFDNFVSKLARHKSVQKIRKQEAYLIPGLVRGKTMESTLNGNDDSSATK